MEELKNGTTGSISLVELHLSGQHDQKTHGHPGAGEIARAKGEKLAEKALVPTASERHGEERKGIKSRTAGIEDKKVLHPAEESLEKLRESIKADQGKVEENLRRAQNDNDRATRDLDRAKERHEKAKTDLDSFTPTGRPTDAETHRRLTEKVKTTEKEIGDYEKSVKETDRELDKASYEDESLRDELDNVKGDLTTVRKRIYGDDDAEFLDNADEIADPTAQKQIKTYFGFAYPGKIGKDMGTGVIDFYADEKVRIQATSRGKKFPVKVQKIGPSLKNGEWPDPAGLREGSDSTRKFEKTAEAKFFHKTDIDGSRVKRGYEITTKDGTKLQAYDLKGIKDPKRVEEMMNTNAYLHELYPQQPTKKLVYLSSGQTARRAGSGRVGAYVFPNTDYIFVNESSVKWNVEKMSAKDHFMPNGSKTPASHYLLSHEFGHQYDFTNRRGSAKALWDDKNVQNSLSKYGRSNPAEGYAEAFAEWHTSTGQTTNAAARAYAKHEKWYGYNGAKKAATTRTGRRSGRTVRTPEGAKLYGVPIGSEIPAVAEASSLIDPWVLAQIAGIISFANEVQEETMDKNIPIIIEDFEGGNPEIRNIIYPEVTDEAKAAAEAAIREAWAELELDLEV